MKAKFNANFYSNLIIPGGYVLEAETHNRKRTQLNTLLLIKMRRWGGKAYREQLSLEERQSINLLSRAGLVAKNRFFCKGGFACLTAQGVAEADHYMGQAKFAQDFALN